MPITAKEIDTLFRVPANQRVHLKDYDARWCGPDELRELGEDHLKQHAKELLTRNLERLSRAQELLWANNTWSLLIIFQAMDAAGKDGTIKHVMSGINPQGCQVYSFKRPSEEELDHNFLWRCMKALPERGRIGIFNRSYYEEVLITRVHPELLDNQKLPTAKYDKAFWQTRFDDINTFEHHLARNGTRIVKFFLHISKAEQKQRFLDRLENPEKHWKFSAADIAERAYWDDYQHAYEEALNATSTDWAPWYIIPADRKYITRTLVAEVLADQIEQLKLKPPRLDRDQQRVLAEARARLLAEKD